MLRLTLILPLLFAMLVRAAAAQTEVAAVPFIQWQKFVDPNEGSFWMEVPSGWRISGGLARRNALQFWPWLTAVSPDGDTIIAFGDPNLQSQGTITVNAEWLARVSDTALAVSRIATATGQAVSDSIMQSWKARNATIDRIMEEGSRARLGIDIYADPTTGNRYIVANTHQYFWVDPSGRGSWNRYRHGALRTVQAIETRAARLVV